MRERDKVFCREYLIDLCAKQAAIRAGYKPSTAADAWEWIRDENPTKPDVKAEIERLMAERSRRTGITQDRVLREWARIAFADISDVADLETGEVLKEAAKDDLAAVASIKVKGGRRPEREVRLHDKNHALGMLAKHLNMLKDNVAITGAVPVIIDDVAEGPEDDADECNPDQ